MSEEPAHACIR